MSSASGGEPATETLSAAELELGVKELLVERVQPFVQQDGGDVEFVRWDSETGFVWLRLLGSCAGCPKSSITLNTQIKQLLIHYFPQIKDVVEHVEEDVIPRGH